MTESGREKAKLTFYRNLRLSSVSIVYFSDAKKPRKTTTLNQILTFLRDN